MITVHHLNNSRSQRVLWLLEELGVRYEVRRYERDAKTMLAPPALLAVHPLGKSPVITDGASTVAESGAIIEYLIDKYGDGRLIPPAGTPERLRYAYWLHYAEGSAMPPLLLKLVFDRVATAPLPWPVSAIARRIAGRVTALHRPATDPPSGFHGVRARRPGPGSPAIIHRRGRADELSARGRGVARRLNASRPKLMAFLDRIHARPPTVGRSSAAVPMISDPIRLRIEDSRLWLADDRF